MAWLLQWLMLAKRIPVRKWPAMGLLAPLTAPMAVMIESSDVVLRVVVCCSAAHKYRTCCGPKQDVKLRGSGVDQVPRVLVWAPTP